MAYRLIDSHINHTNQIVQTVDTCQKYHIESRVWVLFM
ncbi:hypothetical protein EJK53_0351 [Moraxella catarrhalis]|uniref:Uncharacterized protein n=1 Tax=Moraxella catarrhalis TaxID=480 RepID=A0A3S9QEB7_MORCA|nr:hypothetical protein EJK53_0351 [Moraxella catarrhalis]